MKEKFCAHCGRRFSSTSHKIRSDVERVYFHATCYRARVIERADAHANASYNTTERGSLYRLIPGGRSS